MNDQKTISTVSALLSVSSLALNTLGSPYNNSVDSMTELDVLCAVVTITNATYYDYYELATFRAASPCSGVASSVVQLAVEKAHNLSGKYTICFLACTYMINVPMGSGEFFAGKFRSIANKQSARSTHQVV